MGLKRGLGEKKKKKKVWDREDDLMFDGMEMVEVEPHKNLILAYSFRCTPPSMVIKEKGPMFSF